MFDLAFRYPSVYGKSQVKDLQLNSDLAKDYAKKSFNLILRALDIEKITTDSESLFPSENKDFLTAFFLTKLILAFSDYKVFGNFLNAYEKHLKFYLLQEKDAELKNLANSLNLNLRFEDNNFSISLFDFLSADVPTPESLRYQSLEEGRVYLEKEALQKFLAYRMKTDFLNSFPKRDLVPKYFQAYAKTLQAIDYSAYQLGLTRKEAFEILKEQPESLKELVMKPSLLDSVLQRLSNKPSMKGRIRKEFRPAGGFGVVSLKGPFPPCVQAVLHDLEQGVRVPHEQRFFIASYLGALGFNAEEIVPLFKNTPNFDEAVSKYQVEYILKNKYKPFDCEKVDNMLGGICHRNPITKGAKNPLSVQARLTPKKRNK